MISYSTYAVHLINEQLNSVNVCWNEGVPAYIFSFAMWESARAIIDGLGNKLIIDGSRFHSHEKTSYAKIL